MRWVGIAALVFVLWWLMSMSAWTHDIYHSWINKAGQGCCNNLDCRPLADGDERQTAAGVEVRVEGQWCPVLAHHYLQKGNAPDWSSSHVCVQRPYVPGATSACSRLLCYQPRPGI